MFITMLDTRRGCEDGFTIREYVAGVVYDVGDTQARAFINQDRARESTPEEIANYHAAQSAEEDVLTALFRSFNTGMSCQIIEEKRDESV